MGYYRGDFYAGVRGDPGIGSFFGGLFKSAVSLIPGVGPVASELAGKLIPSGAKAAPLAKIAATGGSIIKAGKGVIMKHPVLSAAGAAGIVGAGATAAVEHMRGTHVAGGRRRRRMNSCNPRALRRAIRRTHAFAKLAMKTIHIVHPKKHGTFGGFKKRRRK